MTSSVILRHIEAHGVEPQGGVFFNGGAGAVGSIVLQLLKKKGFRIGVSCSPLDIDRMKRYGVDVIVDYTLQPGLPQLPPSDRFQVFVDGVGSGESFAPCVLDHHKHTLVLQLHPPLEPEDQMGSVAVVKRAMGLIWKTKLSSMISNSSYHYVLTRISSINVRSVLSQISQAIQDPSNPLDLPLDRVFSLGEAIEAQEYWESGKARGKVVLELS